MGKGGQRSCHPARRAQQEDLTRIGIISIHFKEKMSAAESACVVFREMKETGSTNPIGRFRMTTKPFRGIHSCREGVLVSKWLHHCEWMSMNECYHKQRTQNMGCVC